MIFSLADLYKPGEMMKTPSKLILLGVCMIAFTLVFNVSASTEGWWDEYPHDAYIAQGDTLLHYHTHNGAISGSAVKTSSTGTCSFSYGWNAPTLTVSIINTYAGTNHVYWTCRFYVN
jgi:hypothetical protein